MIAASLLAAGCTSDDKPPAADGGASSADASVPGAACENSEDCDDGLFCNGEETCQDAHCSAGKALACDDGIACTIDQCSERTRACTSLPVDADSDGHYSATCDDSDGRALGDDCDDTDPLRFPGNIEFCDADNRDEDCDPRTFGDKDSDNDGYLDATCCNAASDKQGAKLGCGDDCDDRKPSVHPKAGEICDLYDNDCDAKTDEGVAIKQYPDADYDLHGAIDGKTTMKCAGSVGFAPEASDCDDEDPEVFIGQFEICDEKDNDCDDNADEVHEDAPWFEDLDKDSFGDAASTPIYSCERIPGRVLSNNDCRDDKPAINPAAAEICDAVDNDCSGRRDFRLDVNDFEDDDGDDIADDECVGGADCDDRDPSTAGGMDEVCDHIDNDCDKSIDEQTAQTVWFLDADGDGWGVKRGTALTRCEPIPGRAANLGDCDDESNASHPGGQETCNGFDDDCDSRLDEGTDSECVLDDAVGFCKAGGCAVLSCLPGFGDCNALAADGCECAVVVTPGAACGSDADCDDHDYCSGHERCESGNCFPGTPINCSASASVLQGDVVIRNSIDVAKLLGIETITGSLTVSAVGLKNLTGLESLHTIGGDLLVDGDLDNSGGIPEANNALTALVGSGLSNLVTVSGVIVIQDNSVLTRLRFPALVSAGGLEVDRNPALTQIQGFDQLVKLTGSLRVSQNDALEKLELTALTTVNGSVSIDQNLVLDDPSLPKLARLGKNDDESGLNVSGNPALRTLENFAATTLTCESANCGSSVSGNPLLCSVTSLTSRLRDFPLNDARDNRIEGCADTAAYVGQHIRTFDGLAYTFAPAGELTLVKSTVDTLEVQVRSVAFGQTRAAAFGRLVAANLAGDRITLALDANNVLVNGQAPSLVDGLWEQQPGGGFIKRESGNVFTLLWPDGSVMRLQSRGSTFIEIQVALSVVRRGKVVGLFANFNGSTSSELVARDDTAIGEAPSFTDFYETFVGSWRIAQADSMFDYVQGQTTDTFTDATVPSGVTTLARLDAASRTAAEMACALADFSDPDWTDACVLDVAMSGGADIADGYANVAGATTMFEVNTSFVGNFPPFTPEVGETDPLLVVQTLPTIGSTQVDRRTSIAIYFDDEIDPASVSDESMLVTAPGGAQLFGRFSGASTETGNTILYFQPFDTLPASSKITVKLPRVGGIVDDASNQLSAAFTFSFTTRAATTPSPTDLSYEDGTIGWSFSGDSALLTSPQGAIVAPHGTHMAAISTESTFDGVANGDMDGATSSALTSGPISVPANATTLLFDYDFISGEFDLYVGDEFDDTFSVTVTGPLRSESVIVASVNSIGAVASTPTQLAGILDSEGVEVPNPEHSGWLTANIDIASFGSPLTLSFSVTDVGDPLVTSAVFIDNIRFQQINP